MRNRLLIDPDQYLLELLNRAFVLVTVEILKLRHALILLEELHHQYKHLREPFVVSLNHFNCGKRVLPMSPNMLRTARKLVVFKPVVLVDCCVVAG